MVVAVVPVVGSVAAWCTVAVVDKYNWGPPHLQESATRDYEQRIVQFSLNQQSASGAEVIIYSGHDFGEKGKGKTFRIGQPLLLGFGHRNEALKRRRADITTRDLDTVKGAAEKGLQKARKWKGWSPQDVCEKIAEAGNANHGGAGNGWPQLLRLTRFKIDDSWFAFKRKLKKDNEEESNWDANEEYELLWKFVKPRWGQMFSCKQQLIDVRKINRRLVAANSWDLIMDDASKHGDWTGTTMSTSKVVHALLVVTQFFEKELAKSLPEDDLVMQLRCWARFCYPNIEQPENVLMAGMGCGGATHRSLPQS